MTKKREELIVKMIDNKSDDQQGEEFDRLHICTTAKGRTTHPLYLSKMKRGRCSISDCSQIV